MPRINSGTNCERNVGNQNRHVSLANIATAFLSERKSSSRHHPSVRRKKRFTAVERNSLSPRNSSNCHNSNDGNCLQQLSVEKVENGIATIIVPKVGSNNNGKRRGTCVSHNFKSIRELHSISNSMFSHFISS